MINILVIIYNIDKLYLRKLLNAHSKTAIEAYYIEMGLMPIQFIIKCRRLMYWWHINNTDNSSLINRVYQAQKINPVKNDWVHQVSQDKKDFNIDIDDSKKRS